MCYIIHRLGGESYLCCAKAAVYDRHRRDLATLKRLIRKYLPREEYRKMFSDPDRENNYCAYSGMAMRNGKRLEIKKRCGYDDYLKFTEKLLGGIRDSDPEPEAVRAAITARTFMPKATSKDNGVVPNQLHMRELKAILKNAQAYLPFLSEADAEGITVSDKIVQILRFRIPYYVGPLNRNSANSWVARRSQEKIYPWNFEQIVDREASATAFITRMTAKCTYLHDADVLPKNSILYSRFSVLNELNNVRVHGEKLTTEMKQRVFDELFVYNKSMTLPKLARYLKSRGMDVNREDISGVDGGFASSMRPMIEMREDMVKPVFQVRH